MKRTTTVATTLHLRERQCRLIIHFKMYTHKSIIRRYVDWRILPLLALLYSSALIDRINIGAAYTAGMGADLVSI